MLSEVQPCFQLLRIGSSPISSCVSNKDLYTFRPALARCVFRLGRQVDICDVVLQSESCLISRLHAEIQAERDEENTTADWRVFIVDQSTNGTLVNDMRLQRGERVELNDGDTLIFGLQEDLTGCNVSPQDHCEFYFLFQKVQLRPQDFDAITKPKVTNSASLKSSLVPHGFTPVSPSKEGVKELTRRPLTSSPGGRATLILNSIGSISKLQTRPLTFHPEKSNVAVRRPKLAFTLPPVSTSEEIFLQMPPSSQPSSLSSPSSSGGRASKNRRKSAHTVLPELEDEIQRFSEEVMQSAAAKRRLCKSESDAEHELYGHAQTNTDGHLQSDAAPQGRRRRVHSDIVYHSPLTREKNNKECNNVLSPSSPPIRLKSEQERGIETRKKSTDKAQGEANRKMLQKLHITPTGKRRGRPRKHPVDQVVSHAHYGEMSPKVSGCEIYHSQCPVQSGRTMRWLPSETVNGEPCAAQHCHFPQEETVQWVQCDDCDAWYHVACVGCSYSTIKDSSAEFHCGCQ
ncbi:transcription factor 19 [Polypterus senegalus]